MSREEFLEKLERSDSYADIFDVVKRAVKQVLSQYRSGLMLYLGDLPLHVGAFHQVGSNGLVLNRRILEIFSRSAKSVTELNSFVFTLLLHEYLHSLGYLDEGDVRKLVYQISFEVFGPSHPAVQMALDPPFPKIMPADMEPANPDPALELIKDFERSDQPYII